MAARQRNFEPSSVWSMPDGRPTERALGWMRSFTGYIGAESGVIPVASLGGDGVTTTTFYRADGTFAVPNYPTGATPTASLGLTAIPGSAATFMRSDAAPALSLGIAPTWTAVHTFNAGVVTTTLQMSGALTGATTGVFSGALRCGAFGANGAAAQTAASVNAAVAGTAGAAYTATEQGLINNVVTLANQLRALLVANGQAV